MSDEMRMTIMGSSSADLDDGVASLLAEKMARCIGVEAVTINNTPLAYLAPTTPILDPQPQTSSADSLMVTVQR